MRPRTDKKSSRGGVLPPSDTRREDPSSGRFFICSGSIMLPQHWSSNISKILSYLRGGVVLHQFVTGLRAIHHSRGQLRGPPTGPNFTFQRRPRIERQRSPVGAEMRLLAGLRVDRSPFVAVLADGAAPLPNRGRSVLAGGLQMTVPIPIPLAAHGIHWRVTK